MSTLHITRGLPGAGKSTFARAWLAQESMRARVNRDDLRHALFGRSRCTAGEEEAITRIQRTTAGHLLAAGYDVICDDMNLRPRYVREWIRFARAGGHDWEIHSFSISIEESIARDALRPSPVGEAGIRRMGKYLRGGDLLPVDFTFDELKAVAPYQPDPSLPAAWVVDIDGTLALNSGRDPYDLTRVSDDLPNFPVVAVVTALADAGWHIVYCSGRDASAGSATKAWLQEHVGVMGPLHMRAIGDRRRDSIVKRELLDEIGHTYQVCGVLDDRDQVVEMWREVGLACLQVAPGRF